LNERNRKHFYEVRLESLEISIQHISTVTMQIEIGQALIIHEKIESTFIEQAAAVLRSSLQRLKQRRDLVDTMYRNRSHIGR
jgi:hypothetical protein